MDDSQSDVSDNKVREDSVKQGLRMLRIADLAFGLIAQFKNMHVEVPKLPRGMRHDDFLRVLNETQKDVLTYDVRRHAHCINVFCQSDLGGHVGKST